LVWSQRIARRAYRLVPGARPHLGIGTQLVRFPGPVSGDCGAGSADLGGHGIATAEAFDRGMAFDRDTALGWRV
jgi:hypothetical protein